MGAILLAKRLADFPKISRKAIRVIQYEGNNRMQMLKEDIGGKGYVVGFEGLIKFIEALIPTQEVITGALREKRTAYPVLAIREAVANALIHQDFSVSGTGPTVEIFGNRRRGHTCQLCHILDGCHISIPILSRNVSLIFVFSFLYIIENFFCCQLVI